MKVDSATLLSAIRGFLREDVAPQLDAASSYGLKVANNALGIIERDMAQGPALAEFDRSLLSRFGLEQDHGDPRSALARALREKRLEPHAGVIEGLREQAMRTMLIDNPRYGALAEAQARWGSATTSDEGNSQ
jgi:hypothetical protein